MELMNKFELAYELPDKNSYLVPELLPKSAPDFIGMRKIIFASTIVMTPFCLLE